MKKRIVFGLLIMLSWCIGASATTFTCEDQTQCMLMCSYTEKIKDTTYNSIDILNPVTTSIDEEYVEIYSYPDNTYEIIFGTAGSPWQKRDTLANLLDMSVVSGKLVPGECPKSVSVDLSMNAFNKREICFDSTNACDLIEDKNVTGSTRFSSATKTYSGDNPITTDLVRESVAKTYDLTTSVQDKIKSLFSEYKKANYTIDASKKWSENPICAESVKEDFGKTQSEKMTKYIEQQIKNAYFKTTTMPSWVLSSNPYKEVTTYFSTGEGSKLSVQCQALVENDKELSDEEKSDILDDMENGFESFYDNIYNFFENYLKFSFADDFSGPEICEGFLGRKINHSSPAYYLNLILKIMKYAAVILAIVFSIIDFAKATISQDKDNLKKATITSVKRLIFAVLMFFIPILIDFVLGLLGAYTSCV